jgi:hypothetical protein
MKKLTVEAAIEQGLKLGDEVWIKGQVESIFSKDKQPLNITFGEHWAKHYWCWEDIEIYLPEATTEPQPEAALEWQPKEGDLVWNKGVKFKAKIVQGIKGELYYLAFDDNGYERMYSGIQRIKNHFEPYTNQDSLKIDFSVPEQWFTDGHSIIKNTGAFDDSIFHAHYLGQYYTGCLEFRINENWQLLTVEQMQPILAALENLK